MCCAGGTRSGSRLGVARVSTGSLLFRAGLGAALETAAAVAEGRTITTAIPTTAQIQALA